MRFSSGLDWLHNFCLPLFTANSKYRIIMIIPFDISISILPINNNTTMKYRSWQMTTSKIEMGKSITFIINQQYKVYRDYGHETYVKLIAS